MNHYYHTVFKVFFLYLSLSSVLCIKKTQLKINLVNVVKKQGAKQMKISGMKITGLFFVFALTLFLTDSSAVAQNKAVVIPLFSSANKCDSCPPESVVTTSDSIQEAIDNLPAEGGSILDIISILYLLEFDLLPRTKSQPQIV
ncbi:MAG: hypothetical protein D3910_23805 [Candidatus Electrothrix sp. ATG2]|nr:hypothetical protein [Candidatus Electrothrix sp. ATG2]